MLFQDLLTNNIDKFLNIWMILDDKSQIIHWSLPASFQFGYHETEVLGQSFSILLPDFIDQENFFESLDELNSLNEAIINQKTKLRQKNSIIIDVEFTIYDLTQDGVNYKLLSMDNITEEVELQQMVNYKMKQLSEKFQTIDEGRLDKSILEVLDGVLVSITAGQGLKFNRAFLLLIDPIAETLRGVQAIGPSSGEEAGQIYQNFDDAPKTLTEMIQHYHSLKYNKDFKVNEQVRGIKLSLDDIEHILIQTLNTHKYSLINDHNPLANHPSVVWLRQYLSVEECIVVPLIWHERSIGLIIADNQVTRNKITNLDIQKLTRFAKTAVNVIETSRLLFKLEESIIKVNQANLKIKESQAILVQKEKLAAMGELVAHMAHEVRGPLAIIGGFARRLYKSISKEEKYYDSVKRIIDTVETLELVINDILDDNKMEVATKSFSDASKVINKVLGLMEEEIMKKEVSVSLNIQGNLPNIRIKEHHLFEIISNLVKNSIDAIDHDGLLVMLANYIDNQIVLTVQDTGSGISMEKVDKIFSPFYTTKKDGTGLGLVVVKKLIEENDGRIDVVSTPNKGTTFKIFFPIVQQE